MSYDQWKTASPYDDEPDPVEDAENWLTTARRDGIEKIDPNGVAYDEYLHWKIQLASAYVVITALVDYIEDNI